jgi:hypothetical protein
VVNDLAAVMASPGLTALVVVALAVVGCGARTSILDQGNAEGLSDGGSAGSDGNSGEDGQPCVGGGIPCVSSACPSTPPTAGTICTTNNLWCEYGSSPNPRCDDLWQCLGRDPPYTWHNMTMTSTGICSPPGAVCPVSYAVAMATSGNCMTERICDYPEGTCLCTSFPGGNPAINGPVWSCIPLSAGCPSPRPQLGSPCTTPGPLCDYGACSGGVDEQCIDGFWAIATVGCPH